jgi:hypothetical protein
VNARGGEPHTGKAQELLRERHVRKPPGDSYAGLENHFSIKELRSY